MTPLPAEQPGQHVNNRAYQKRGHDRKIKAEIAPFDHDIAGQSAQSEPRNQRPRDSGNKQDPAENNQKGAHGQLFCCRANIGAVPFDRNP
jgi:hypothetical protein